MVHTRIIRDTGGRSGGFFWKKKRGQYGERLAHAWWHSGSRGNEPSSKLTFNSSISNSNPATAFSSREHSLQTMQTIRTIWDNCWPCGGLENSGTAAPKRLYDFFKSESAMSEPLLSRNNLWQSCLLRGMSTLCCKWTGAHTNLYPEGLAEI